MLCQESFNRLSKEQLYSIYTDLYKKNEERESIIINYIKNPTEGQRKDDNSGSLGSFGKDKSNNQQSVRTFRSFPIYDHTENLILGSSIVKNLVHDKSIPKDITTHAYRGSTTSEKLLVLDSYPEKKLKTVVLQDGTNAIAKHSGRSVEDLFEDYQKLVDKVLSKFTPDVLVLMEVPPFKNSLQNENKNQRINEFNRQLNEKYGMHNLASIKVASVHKMITSFPNYNFMFYDDVHFDNLRGLPFLKNILLQHLLCTSNGEVASIQRRPNSYNYNYQKQPPYWHRNNQWQQTYNYMSNWK